MVSRPPRVPESAHDLAAKLKAITEAAPGLRAAGVTRATIGADSFELAEPVPPPAKDDRPPVDPYNLRPYRGKGREPDGGAS